MPITDTIFELSAGIVVLYIVYLIVRGVFDLAKRGTAGAETTNTGLMYLINSLIGEFKTMLEKLIETQETLSHIVEKIDQRQTAMAADEAENERRQETILLRLDDMLAALERLEARLVQNSQNSTAVTSGELEI